jgi:hypothetical protein
MFTGIPILTIKGKLLTQQFAEITMDEVRAHAQLYQDRGTRDAQDAEMLIQCLKASITRSVYNKVYLQMDKYTIYSRSYQPDYKLTLPLIFLSPFPFRQRGIEEERQTHFATEECLNHYLNISLPMFQHSDIILLIHHIYFRKKSYQSAFLICMSRSSLSESEILEVS